MSKRDIKVGSRVAFISRVNEGRGTVITVRTKKTGQWLTIKSKDHPLGQVTVRRSQVS